jgi:signal-transduction protein with cAMP-binding, CBS, and nucleotidyltransferase domain
MAIDPFWGNLFRRSSQKKDELYNILKEVLIFQDLNRREFRKIEGILHSRSYAADESIVREGELGAGMYLIVTGRVEIVQTLLALGTFLGNRLFWTSPPEPLRPWP